MANRLTINDERSYRGRAGLYVRCAPNDVTFDASVTRRFENPGCVIRIIFGSYASVRTITAFCDDPFEVKCEARTCHTYPMTTSPTFMTPGVTARPLPKRIEPFYVELMAASKGVVVELGVGNGRICIEVAKRDRRVIGVDSSKAILSLCRTRAEQAGVADRLAFVRGDFRDFEIPEPAELMTMPFHAIGHLMTNEDKKKALRNIHRQLVPGGRFVFDHFIFDPDYPIPPGIPHLRAEIRDPETGRDRLLWETSIREASRQVIRVLVCTEDLDDDGAVVNRRYRRADISWMSPEDARALLEESGFEIEAVYGDFFRAPLEAGSPEQVWIARRPVCD